MTDRLYYYDSYLCEFDAVVVTADHAGVVLDRTAFYPTSGGQIFDTGWLVHGGKRLRVTGVSDRDDGDVLHAVEGPAELKAGDSVRGQVDVERRRDHMQQHSGQHVLSAAFIKLFDLHTVSFHMGADYCSIDLDTRTLSTEQVVAAESLANDVISENRSVQVRYVTQDEARGLGLRKLPPAERQRLRLVEICNFDLTACGGTHVRATGEIGTILLRKLEKVRQGCRVEFVCGKRAVKTARADYTALAESAALLSTRLTEVPQQVRKSQDEARAAKKEREALQQEVANFQAEELLAWNRGKPRVIVQLFPDRDLAFLKLLAQTLVRQESDVVALLAVTHTPALVFAQSPGGPFNMGALMKDVLGELGGGGGGSRDMAQGGPVAGERIADVLNKIAKRLET